MDASRTPRPDPAACRTCPDLFTVNAFQEVVFCHGARGRFIDDYRDRNELYSEFCRAARPDACPRRTAPAAGDNRAAEFNDSDPDGYDAFVALIGARGRHGSGPRGCSVFPRWPATTPASSAGRATRSAPDCPTRSPCRRCSTGTPAPFPRSVSGGGEPTLYPHLLELLTRAGQRGLFTQIFTNARRLADPAFTGALLATGLGRITVTLHSHCEETHDRFTRRPGSWRETVAGLHQLQRAGFRNLTVMLIVSRENCDHLDALLRFALSFHPRHVNINSLVLLGDALANASGLALPLSRTAPAIEAALDLLQAQGVPCTFASHPLCLFRRRYWRYAASIRYALEVRTLPGIDRGYVKNGGTALAPRCVDCGLKRFCPGTWYASLAHLGDSELQPQRLTPGNMLHLPATDIYRLLVDTLTCGLTRHRPLPGWLRSIGRRFYRLWTKYRSYD